MGAGERRPEGLIKNWLKRDGAAAEVDDAPTTATSSRPSLPPVVSAKERLAAARRQLGKTDTAPKAAPAPSTPPPAPPSPPTTADAPPGADPVLLAKLAALQAAEPATPAQNDALTSAPAPEPAAEPTERASTPADGEPGTMKERLAARRAAQGGERRDASAAVLGALDTSEQRDAEPVAEEQGDAEQANTPAAPAGTRAPAGPVEAAEPATTPSARPDQDERRARLARMVANRVAGDVEDPPTRKSASDDSSVVEEPDAAAPVTTKASAPDAAAPVTTKVSAPDAATTPGSDDDIIAALRDLPAHSAAATAAQAPDHGRHRSAPTASERSTPAEAPPAPADDPALRATLRAVEAAEAKVEEPTRRRLSRRRGTEGATPTPAPPATAAPGTPTPAPKPKPTPASTAPPPAELGTPPTMPPLDPVVAQAMRSVMDADESPGAAAPTTPPAAAPAKPAAAAPATPTATAAAPTTAPPTEPAATPDPPTPHRSAPTPRDDVPATVPKAASQRAQTRRTPAARTEEASRQDPGLRSTMRDLSNAPTSPKAPPGVVQFSPRRSTRQLLGMLSLLTLLGAVGTGFLAWDTRGTTEIAIACTLVVLTLILWSAFSTAAPAKLTIDRGVLDIVSKESRHRFDLASPYTEIQVKGEPGRRGWQVQILRRSMKPFVIDSSMVDPEEFQPVLEHYREIAAETAEENERRRERR